MSDIHVQLDHLEEICAWYDKVYGEHPEHSLEGESVFRFIKEVIAKEKEGLDYSDADKTEKFMKSLED